MPRLSVLHHQGRRLAVHEDVAQLFHRGRGSAHGISGTGTHQPLIRHEPAGAVLGKKSHHIAIVHAMAPKGGGSGGDALSQFAEIKAFGMRRMGGIDGGYQPVAVGEPGPHRINPRQPLNMVMTLQSVRFAGYRAPAGRHPRQGLKQLRSISLPPPRPDQNDGPGLAAAAAAPQPTSALATSPQAARPHDR